VSKDVVGVAAGRTGVSCLKVGDEGCLTRLFEEKAVFVVPVEVDQPPSSSSLAQASGVEVGAIFVALGFVMATCSALETIGEVEAVVLI
jgi:hypothetical protein